MSRPDRLEFHSWNGEQRVRTGQGNRAVFVQLIRNDRAECGIVFTDEEAEAFGRSLIRRARYSRRPEDPE